MCCWTVRLWMWFWEENKDEQVQQFPHPEREREVAQSCLTLCGPMDCSLPGSSIFGILQARVLEWGAISFSRRSSQPRDRTWVSRIIGRPFTIWATREVLRKRITVKTQLEKRVSPDLHRSLLFLFIHPHSHYCSMKIQNWPWAYQSSQCFFSS